MILSDKTLEVLRDMINEKTEYRSGPKLVELFNKFGFCDSYGQGFPSRWRFTDDKLQHINGTPELDKVVKFVFSPSSFVGRYEEPGNLIKEFNQYIAFDGWELSIVGRNVEIHRADINAVNKKIQKECNSSQASSSRVSDFLSIEYADVNAEQLPIDEHIKPIINCRIKEMKQCFNAKACLSTIIICGSLLEGVLLGLALSNPREFNTSKSAPKKDGKVLQFQNWTLSQYIDVAYDLGYLREDVKKFSQSLRDFRNYIHPFQQMSANFYPDEHTAKICLQVLKAGLFQIANFKRN